MVRNGLSDAERRYWSRVLGLGFVVVVAGSMGLIALRGDASPVEVALATGTGLVAGSVLALYLSRLSFEEPGRNRR